MKTAAIIAFALIIVAFLPIRSKNDLFLLQQLSYSVKRFSKEKIKIAKSFRKSNLAEKRQSLDLTNRVKRIIIFEIVFACLVYFSVCVIFYKNNPIAYTIALFIACAFILTFSSLFVVAGTIFELPIELILSRHYERKCKNKLKNAKIVIGITGSYGKTSVKNVLKELLSEKYTVFATPKSFNTPMGIARCVNSSYNNEEVAIIEMGARKRGDIKKICKFVRVDIAVITSLGVCHLDSFESVETIEKTKNEIVKNSFAKIAFFGKNAKSLFDKCDIKKCYYNDSFSIENISFDKSGATFDFIFNSNRKKLSTKLLGGYVADNVLLCAEIAKSLDVPFDGICRGIERLTPVPHRLELVDSDDFIIIDDSYNSNPESAKAALLTMDCFGGKKFVITSGFVELGEREYSENYLLGKEIANHCDYAVLVGEKRSKPIIKGLTDFGFSEERIVVAKSLNEATNAFSKLVKKGDAVLFLNDLPDIYLR